MTALRTLPADLRLDRGAHDPDGRMCVMGLRVSDADLERFRSHLAPPDENSCILWTGSTMWKGYGRFWVDGRFVRAHRFSYALSSDLPEGPLDHLCRLRLCVNPMHLEPVTPRENLMRSPIAPAAINARKTHCPQGHPYSGDNVRRRKSGRDVGARYCAACSRERERKRRAAR